MFDINKPHQRRDGGKFEIVAIKDRFAFGFTGKNPAVWVVNDNCLKVSDPMESNLDIIQLPEVREVVWYQNVYDAFLGNQYSNLGACESVKNRGTNYKGIIKTTAKIIDDKLVSVKSEIVE